MCGAEDNAPGAMAGAGSHAVLSIRRRARGTRQLHTGETIASDCLNTPEEASSGAVGREIYSVLKRFSGAATCLQTQSLSHPHCNLKSLLS